MSENAYTTVTSIYPGPDLHLWLVVELEFPILLLVLGRHSSSLHN